MAPEWWSLPGPAGWIEDVVCSLRSGCSVILQLPTRSPRGLREALERQIAIGGSWRWTPIWLDKDCDAHQHPASLIWKRICGDRISGAITVTALASSDHLLDQVIWLENLGPHSWPQWHEFLDAYVDAVLERNSWDRGLFIACYDGHLGQEPRPKVGLSIHKLVDCCSQLDMTLWAATQARASQGSGNLERLRIAIVTELAGADPDLADALLELDLEVLMDPAEGLRALANEWGWDSATNEEPNWISGTMHYVDGQPRVHSLFLARAGASGEAELQRRIWRAQVTVLFPFLEQERIRLLDELRPLLRPIDRWDNGERRDVQELELAHILAQARSRVDRPMRRRLLDLVELRNALAHLEPADARLVRAVLRNSA